MEALGRRCRAKKEFPMSSTRELFLERGYAHLPRGRAQIDLTALEREYTHLTQIAERSMRGLREGRAAFLESDLIVVPEAGDPRLLCRIEYIAGASDHIRAGLVGQLAHTIETLIEEPVILFKDKCNLKHPGGGGFPPHQDITAYRHFGTRYHVTAAVPLDPAVALNGGLEMALDWDTAPAGA